MDQQEGSSQDSLSLGKIYSKLLPSYRWKLTSVYRQKAVCQDRNGRPVLDHKNLYKLHLFREDGQGIDRGLFSSNDHEVFHFSWKFSNDGTKFTLVEDGARMTYNVIDLEESHFVIDGPRTGGGFVRLVYRQKGSLLGGDVIDLGREQLLCKALQAQIRSTWDQIQDLWRRLATGGPKVKELERSLRTREGTLKHKREMLKVGRENVELGRGRTRKELLAMPVAQTDLETRAGASLSSLRAFLSSVIWSGPPRFFHSRGYGKVPALYMFDKQGAMWVTMKDGGDHGRYQPLRAGSDRNWRACSVNLEEGCFELTNAPLGAFPAEDHCLVRFDTNFIGYSTNKDNKKKIVFNRRKEGYRLWAVGRGRGPSGRYYEHPPSFTAPNAQLDIRP